MSPDYAKIFAECTESRTPGAELVRVSEIQSKQLRWLWPGRIPLGKISLFAGDPGLGKSLVTLDIAARVTRGFDWPDGAINNQPGSVIILSAEDDVGDTIRPRLEAAGANLDKVYSLPDVFRIDAKGALVRAHFSLETDLQALREGLLGLDEVRLVVIDPVSAYLGTTDSHVNGRVRTLIGPLAELAADLNVAILLVTHLNKSISSAIYRATGSIAFVAASRAVWLFAKHRDDTTQCVMVPLKMNLSRKSNGLSYFPKETDREVPIVEWGSAVDLSADEVLEPEAIDQGSERREVMEWLTAQLSDGDVSQKEIEMRANASGISRSTLRRAKRALGVVSKKTGMRDGWVWGYQAPEAVQPTSKMSIDW